MAKTFRVGVVGYGGAFNMGKLHLQSIARNEGFVPAAVCEPDAARREVAQTEFPGVAAFDSLEKMLRARAADLAIIITPHNTHAPLVVRCLKAGLHVVCEKPLAITANEVSAMLAAARVSGTMLSTFHNRRWDGDFVTLRRIVRDGWIGRPFRIECGHTGYRRQGTWWRSDRAISGGAIYDWGAHFTDWMLNLVEGPVASVTGFQVKHPAWTAYSNEDHSEMTLRFSSGCLATLTISNLAMEPKPRWLVLGDQGSVVDGGGHFRVRTLVRDRPAEARFDFEKSDWDGYYANVAGHLRRKEPLVITAESAARVIGMLAAANASAARGGRAVKPRFP